MARGGGEVMLAEASAYGTLQPEDTAVWGDREFMRAARPRREPTTGNEADGNETRNTLHTLFLIRDH